MITMSNIQQCIESLLKINKKEIYTSKYYVNIRAHVVGNKTVNTVLFKKFVKFV